MIYCYRTGPSRRFPWFPPLKKGCALPLPSIPNLCAALPIFGIYFVSASSPRLHRIAWQAVDGNYPSRAMTNPGLTDSDGLIPPLSQRHDVSHRATFVSSELSLAVRRPQISPWPRHGGEPDGGTPLRPSAAKGGSVQFKNSVPAPPIGCPRQSSQWRKCTFDKYQMVDMADMILF